MLQLRPDRRPSGGHKKAHDASDGDDEAAQTEQRRKELVFQKCNRIHKNKALVARRTCETTSIMNSEESNVAEQSDTAAGPICNKECQYRWLLRHVLAEHLCHDELSRPQPRPKPKG
ncbi:hypothetical protein TRVL_08464 [Trypanosoma vivax]|nr:hypothetical protein TRVL_08464 [Trypanosoma vivax]